MNLPVNSVVEFKENPADEKSTTMIGKVIDNNEVGDLFIEWTSPHCKTLHDGKVVVPKKLFSRRETEVILISKPHDRTTNSS